MATKQTYETPAMRELGSVTEMTQEYGWGLAELFASIVTGGPITIGKCSGSCFS